MEGSSQDSGNDATTRSTNRQWQKRRESEFLRVKNVIGPRDMVVDVALPKLKVASEPEVDTKVKAETIDTHEFVSVEVVNDADSGGGFNATEEPGVSSRATTSGEGKTKFIEGLLRLIVNEVQNLSQEEKSCDSFRANLREILAPVLSLLEAVPVEPENVDATLESSPSFPQSPMDVNPEGNASEVGAVEEVSPDDDIMDARNHVYAFSEFKEDAVEETAAPATSNDVVADAGGAVVDTQLPQGKHDDFLTVTGFAPNSPKKIINRAAADRKKVTGNKRRRDARPSVKKSKSISQDCLFCPKKCVNKYELEVHIRVHTGERPFWCGVCGKEFAQKSSLTSHQRIHTGEKPYQCKLCPRRFATSGHLTVHVRLHLGEKPWKCPDCRKAFVQKCYLIQHRVLHTREKPFECNFCPRKFAHSSALSKHRKVHC